MRNILIAVLMLPCIIVQGQFAPGFNPKEYLELLNLSNQSYIRKDSVPEAVFVYRSPELGLKNEFDIWLRKDNTGIINIRGTVQHVSSWLENFYSAMTPAKGNIQINDSTVFRYKLAEDSAAAVHVGWTIGLAHMAPDIVDRINRLAKEKGVRNFVIFGHSQGGALSFLTTSYLYYLQQEGSLSREYQFKTYCSAAPRPGNLYYAYDYDFITRNGKSFTVVNSADWVPELGFTLQTLQVFNPVNPFSMVKATLKKQKMLARWYLNSVYNKLDNSSARASRKFTKYLGDKLYPQVKKFLPQLREPEYVNSLNYMRAGIPIVLRADPAYHAAFDKPAEQVFQHHLYDQYAWLTRHIYLDR